MYRNSYYKDMIVSQQFYLYLERANLDWKRDNITINPWFAVVWDIVPNLKSLTAPENFEEHFSNFEFNPVPFDGTFKC